MSIETVKMSSKGQIVIPQDIREELQVDTGTVFAVMGSDDTIVLKKMEVPSKEKLIKDLRILAQKAKKKLQAKGITEADLRAR